MAESANEHVRISAETKERLRRRKREDESFNEVIVRLLDDDRDLPYGFRGREQPKEETLNETVVQ